MRDFLCPKRQVFTYFVIFALTGIFSPRVSAAPPPGRCIDISLGAFVKEGGTGGVPTHNPTPKTWTPKLEAVKERLEFISSLLERHPGMITRNLSFRRNLLEAFEPVPELIKALGEHAASLDVTPAEILHAKYTSSGEVKYDQNKINQFRDARAKDLEGLNLRGQTLAEELSFIKQDSTKEGKLDEALFKKQIKKLMRVMPLVYDSQGKRIYSTSEQTQALKAKLNTMTVGEFQNLYFDLVKEHLAGVVKEAAKQESLEDVLKLFTSTQSEVYKKELADALKPLGEDGNAVSTRDLTLESLSAPVAIARGCYGGDCSILTVPYYPLVKESRVHFIRKNAGKNGDMTKPPDGYVLSVLVEVPSAGEGGKTEKVPYVLTINGSTLTKSDTEMAVRMVAEDWGSSSVVLPDFQFNKEQNKYLVNTDAARSGMTEPSGKAVEVTLPKGWKVIDDYLSKNKYGDATNYYESSKIRQAILVRLPKQEKRLIGAIVKTKTESPHYNPTADLGKTPPLQRAILAAQVLPSGKEKTPGVSKAEVLKVLNTTEVEMQAARPITEVTPDRALTLAEYNEANKKLGFSLKNIGELDVLSQAKTLGALYKEKPDLFTEAEWKKAIDKETTLLDNSLHGLEQNQEAVRAILRAKLELPEKYIQDSLYKTILALMRLEGGKRELQLRGLDLALIHPSAFSKNAKREVLAEFLKVLETQDGMRENQQRLRAVLRRNKDIFDAALELLEENRHPVLKEFKILQAFQEIRLFQKEGQSFEQAERAWLTKTGPSPELKAEVLLTEFGEGTGGRFEEFEKLIPEVEREKVWAELDRTTSLRVMRDLAKERGVLDYFYKKAKLESFQVAEINTYGVGVTKVTQFEWVLVMGENPSIFKKRGKPLKIRGKKVQGHFNRPVENVSYNEVIEFIKRKNLKDKRNQWRLPTEEEWEKAARGGSKTEYSFGDDDKDLGDYGWFDKNSNGQTHDVANKLPSPSGLYDVHGNVWEWTSSLAGSNRVIRGGGWYGNAEFLRSVFRGFNEPDHRSRNIGFRLLRTPP